MTKDGASAEGEPRDGASAESEPRPLTADEVLGIRVKGELRKRLRALRRTSTLEACRARSEKIVTALLALPEIQNARAVALFWPIEEKREVDLRPLDTALQLRGVRVAYPTINPDTRLMTFRYVSHPPELEERGMGFSEPSHDNEEASELSVVVVPAIAADERGHRIGYGAGYYDRTLARFCPPAIAIAVAYDYQLVIEVPATPHDIAVSLVVTDARTIDARAHKPNEGA